MTPLEKGISLDNIVDDLLTVQEVAKYLRINQYTVYHMMKNGKLKGFKLDRRWRIYKSSLKTLIDKAPKFTK